MRRDNPGEPSELDQADMRDHVTDQVAPPSTRDPDLLPFHERSWQDFEKIVLVVAEHADGLRSVRTYGLPRQRQYGIDIYGTGDDSEKVGYQASAEPPLGLMNSRALLRSSRRDFVLSVRRGW